MKNFYVVSGEIAAGGRTVLPEEMAAARKLFASCFSISHPTQLWESGNLLTAVVSVAPGAENGNGIALLCSKWITQLNQSLRLTGNAGVSGLHSDFAQISAACREAQEMLNRIFTGNTVKLYGYREEKADGCLDGIAATGGKTLLDSTDLSQPRKILGKLHVFFRELQHQSFRFPDLQTMMILLLAKVFRKTTGSSEAGQGTYPYATNYGSRILACQSLNTLYGCAEDILLGLPSGEPGEYGYESKLKRKVDQYIKDNYCKEVNLNALAEELHLNPSYVSRAYKRDAGVSVITALNAYRVERAKRLLKSGEYNVSQVADAVGFFEPAYFAKIFKKYTGKTPKAFLAESSGRPDTQI